MQTPSARLSRAGCRTCVQRSGRIFCDLTGDALAEFDALGMQIQLPAGTVVFTEQDYADGVFVICAGQIKLSCSSKEGKTLILKVAQPGDVLGLGAVVSGAPFEVTATTIMPTVIKKIRSDDMIKFLQHHAEAGMHAAKALSEDYKNAFFDARRLALSGSAAGRLASVLLEWGKSSRCDQGSLNFNMALTHEDIASIAGTTRETVTRILGKFQKDKLIQIRGVSVRILSPDLLSALCM